MGSQKIKVREIEGTQEEVLGFFEKSGIDACDYLNSAKKIKVPLYTIIAASVSFIVFSILAGIVANQDWLMVFTILAIATAFTNAGLIYMCWKNKTLTGIIAFGEILILALALHIYTPKEAIKKIEDKIEKYENI